MFLFGLAWMNYCFLILVRTAMFHRKLFSQSYLSKKLHFSDLSNKKILLTNTLNKKDFKWWGLTNSWQRSLFYRNQSIDLQNKSMDWCLYDKDLRHERDNFHIKTKYICSFVVYSICGKPPYNLYGSMKAFALLTSSKSQ